MSQPKHSRQPKVNAKPRTDDSSLTEAEAIANMKRYPGEYGDHRVYKFLRDIVCTLHQRHNVKVSMFIYGKDYVNGLNLAWVQIKRRRFYILLEFVRHKSGELRGPKNLQSYSLAKHQANAVVLDLRKKEGCRIPEGGRMFVINPNNPKDRKNKVDSAVAIIEEHLADLDKRPNVSSVDRKERKRHGRRTT